CPYKACGVGERATHVTRPYMAHGAGACLVHIIRPCGTCGKP
ncbi:hypothetical protein A2U01_0051319, partial [Trifolium medium]|nr:hypothetical protein [Trifolium medium]